MCLQELWWKRPRVLLCSTTEKSGFFSAQIGINNDSNLEKETALIAPIDNLDDSSTNNSDDHSFDFGIGRGTPACLDFGDSSDDSSDDSSKYIFGED